MNKITNAKLTKLAIDRAEFLLTSAVLGLLAFAETGLFLERFSAEPELRDPRSNFLVLEDITSCSLKKYHIVTNHWIQKIQST